MSKSTINVGREVAALLRKLELDPGFVKEFRVTPTSVTATVFKADENGNKHLVDAEPYLPAGEDADMTTFSQVPATEVIEFTIRT